jgi:hypothetical protein
MGGERVAAATGGSREAFGGRQVACQEGGLVPEQELIPGRFF